MSSQNPPSDNPDSCGVSTQYHNGSGDNVNGPKIVNHMAVSPESLMEPIRNILASLRHRRNEDAISQLHTISATSGLNSEATATLKIVQLLTDIAQGEPPKDGYQQLISCLNIVNHPVYQDIAISAQIRLDINNKKLDDGFNRYNAIELPREYTNEVYFEFLSEKEGIELAFKEKKLQLGEVELCGLVRGALRLNIPSQALSIAEYLQKVSPSFNADALVVLCKARIIDTDMPMKSYWSITASAREEILALGDDAARLLKECKGKDFRIIDLSTSLLKFVYGEHELLSDVCWEYIAEIEAKLPDIAQQIRLGYEKQPSNISDFSRKVLSAANDSSFRNQLVTEITECKLLSFENSALLSKLGSKRDIQEWIKGGGAISSESRFEEDFAILDLKSIACTESPRDVDDLRTVASNFIENHQCDLLTLNPQRLVQVADRLTDLGISTASCELLKPQIPEQGMWASPVVRSYIRALLESKQFLTLSTVLTDLDHDEWDGYVWSIRAHQLDCMHEYPEAINSIEEAIKRDPFSLYHWAFLIRLLKKSGSAKEVMSSTLGRIPKEAFNSPSDLGFSILNEIALAGDFPRAESHVVEWFVQNPDSCAKPFSDFCFSASLFNDTHQELSSYIGKCYGGVVYTADGNNTTRLLVSEEVEKHQSLISLSSSLGQLLHNMSIGETGQHGACDIKVIEKLPPYIGAFRVATEIRQNLNDGSDCFYSFTPPEDPDEAIKYIERKISALSMGGNALDANPKIPLLMRGFHYNNNDPVKAALYHLTRKETVKQDLPSFGVENAGQIIVDAFSAAYMALIGITKYLFRKDIKVFITEETKYYIEKWLSDINQKDYMSVGVCSDGRLWRSTAEDIRQGTKDIQNELIFLIDHSQVITPNLVDMPPEFLRIEGIVDLSITSSLRLSVANDIPWLCIDSYFAYLVNESIASTINAQQLFIAAGKNMPMEEKLKGIHHHIFSNTPYPLTFEDIQQLSSYEKEYSPFYLAKIISKYPAAISNLSDAVNFYSDILTNILRIAYIDGEILNGIRAVNPACNGYTELVFNTCCRNLIKYPGFGKAEYKLSTLLAILFYNFRNIPKLNELVAGLATLFASGHFMSFEGIDAYTRDLVDELVHGNGKVSIKFPSTRNSNHRRED